MTREEFFQENPEFNHIGSPISIFEQIIIDDFESRICENCKWYEDEHYRRDCALFDMDMPCKGCSEFEGKEADVYT